MENPTNLPEDQEIHINSAKYILDELEPSERLEFLAKLENDQNLLIEVESLRATLRKTQTLPLVNAPTALIESVLKNATAANAIKPVRLLNRIWYSAAASLLIILGGTWYFVPDSNTSSSKLDPKSSVVVSKNAGTWKDKNQVLTIQQVAAKGSVESDSVVKSSTSKLKPVEGVVAEPVASPSVTLTRTVRD